MTMPDDPPVAAYAETVSPRRRALMLGSIVALNMLALAATDLYLPSVPALPEILGISLESAQMTLVAFAAGFAISQIFMGAFGDIYSRRAVLGTSVALFVPATIACAMAQSTDALIAARFVQGAAGAASAALTAPLIRALFEEARAIHAMSIIGSIDAVIPAFAPILGAWIFISFGWSWNFWLLAIITIPAGLIAFLAMPRELPKPGRDLVGALLGYTALLKHPAYMGYALSHAAALGGFLGLVFSTPALLRIHMDGGPSEFVGTQILWVGVFLIAAQMTGRLAARLGADRLIMVGNQLQIVGGVLLVGYTLLAANPVWWLHALAAVPTCIGLGLRGGAGFARAIDMMPSHAARASAFILFASMAATALCTAAAAPFLETGVWAGAVSVLVMSVIALMLLRLTRQ